MLPRRRPKRLAGDNPLLKRHFIQELEGKFRAGIPFATNYPDWLREHGIDPTTGRMTERGVAFFKTLIEEQNAVNRAKRTARRAA